MMNLLQVFSILLLVTLTFSQTSPCSQNEVEYLCARVSNQKGDSQDIGFNKMEPPLSKRMLQETKDTNTDQITQKVDEEVKTVEKEIKKSDEKTIDEKGKPSTFKTIEI